MAQTCRVCLHPRRDEIERSIIGRVPYRKIEQQFQVSISALSRHKDHVPAALLGAARAAQSAEESEIGKSITAMLAEMRGFQKRLKQSRQRNNPATLDSLLKISKEIRALLELRSRHVTPRASQSRANTSPQEPTELEDIELSETEADELARKWLVRRGSASGNAGDAPSKRLEQQAVSRDCPRDVRLEDAV